MNIFFGITNNELKYRLTVPKFQNNSNPVKFFKLFSIKTNNNKWIINKVNCNQDNFFYYVDCDNIEQLFENHRYFINKRVGPTTLYAKKNN